MEKYLINLPNGKRIKYRVTQRTDKWTLIEAVIDEEILSFLNHFASEGESTPEKEDKKPAEKPKAAPKEKEPEKKEPAAFTEEQIQKMKEVKTKLGVKSNQELSPWIQEWSLYHGKDWTYLNSSNIDSFIDYLYDKIL